MGTVTIAELNENLLPVSKEVLDEVAASRRRKNSELVKHFDVLNEFCWTNQTVFRGLRNLFPPEKRPTTF